MSRFTKGLDQIAFLPMMIVEVSLIEPGPHKILASLAAFRERTSATGHLWLLEAASFATPESCVYSSSFNRKDAASTFSSR